jgi:hypothetical protein
LLHGCTASSENASNNIKFVRAEVCYYFTPSGRRIPDRKQPITDPATVQRLVSFFPGVGEGRESDTAGGWEASVRIRLLADDGKTVTISSDFDDWSEGKGDWKVHGDLGALIADLFPPAPPLTSDEQQKKAIAAMKAHPESFSMQLTLFKARNEVDAARSVTLSGNSTLRGYHTLTPAQVAEVVDLLARHKVLARGKEMRGQQNWIADTPIYSLMVSADDSPHLHYEMWDWELVRLMQDLHGVIGNDAAARLMRLIDCLKADLRDERIK